jgi:GTP-binding protein EngB required for normal cell division
MLLRTEPFQPAIEVPENPSKGRSSMLRSDGESALRSALGLGVEIVRRYEISDLEGLLATTQGAAAQEEISVAVLGRFKAGKSSFLNDFLGRNILPVGVTPVTAIVTEIRYGTVEHAKVHRLDGRVDEVPLQEIGAFISERENPENRKQVAFLAVELPELARFRGLKFVDTPGLESALGHNTETSLGWLPNVGLALVAVSVDPPLSQRDIDLLRGLYQYTPRVAILLTKADLLSQNELSEVIEYVGSQLSKQFANRPEAYPYSVRPGFEYFKTALETAMLRRTLDHFAEERKAIVSRKADTLLGECHEYLTLSLRSAELIQSERHALKRQVIGEKDVLDEVNSEIHLVVQHVAAGTRSATAGILEAHQPALEEVLGREFSREFPKWTKSLGVMLSSFEDWLGHTLEEELAAVSLRERHSIVSPLYKVQKQVFRILQQFRDRLSDRTMKAFGVPLRTTETEIAISEPGIPDIRVGNILDRNWELLSPIIPVWLIRRLVSGHFRRTISDRLYQNLSRLTTQWEESITEGLWRIEKDAKHRLGELIATVDRLIESGSQERTPRFRADLERIDRARKSLTDGHV